MRGATPEVCSCNRREGAAIPQTTVSSRRFYEFIAHLWAIGATGVASRLQARWEATMARKDPRTGSIGRMSCTLPNGIVLTPREFLPLLLQSVVDQREHPRRQVAPRAERRRRQRSRGDNV